MVRIIFENDAETVFSVDTEDVRDYIRTNDVDMSSSDAGIINKYIFPLVIDKFDDRPFKHIKVKGNYEHSA